TPETMSYDSNNDFFSNVTYNVTNANFVNGDLSTDNGLMPNYQGTAITQQNSFTYLQTVLGMRPSTSQVALADENLPVKNSGPQTVNFVDPNYYSTATSEHAATIGAVGTQSGNLQRAGDYAAYNLTLVNAPSWMPGQELD